MDDVQKITAIHEALKTALEKISVQLSEAQTSLEVARRNANALAARALALAPHEATPRSPLAKAKPQEAA